MRNKLLTILTVSAVLGLSSTVYAGQWYKENDKWCYKYDDGHMQKDGWFIAADGRQYNFSGGYARTGWYKEGDNWYFFDYDSAEKKTGWIVDNTKQSFFLNPEGIMQTGWVISNGKWYFLDTDGHMVTGEIVTTNENKFHFAYDGTLSMNTWIGDNEYYANETGVLAKGQWVGDTYVGKNSQASDNGTSKKNRIPYKYYSLQEYKDMALDSVGRYGDSYNELLSLINEYRDDYNERYVYTYQEDDDDWIENRELKEFEEDEEMNKAACLRAVELASQQRGFGARPDGRKSETILSDYGIPYVSYAESVAFGQDDYEAVYEDLESGSNHTNYWRNIKYDRIGIGCAYDEDGKAYWVVLYVE